MDTLLAVEKLAEMIATKHREKGFRK